VGNGTGRTAAPASGFSVEKIVEVAQKAGKWGIAGLVVLMIKSAIMVIAHPSLDSATDALGIVGYSLALIGVLANTKRGNDMTATIGAESKIDRAAIATALDTTTASKVIPVSSDKAVDREIKKIQNGNGGQH
jgi:orotidine-5'-phosphate decarboxylase